MKRMRIWQITMCLVAVCAFHSFALKGMLEKKLYYITAKEHVQDTVSYWAIFLGTYDVTIDRKFPGEPKQPIDASINFSLLSNGYIQGQGYSEKGEIHSEAELKIVVDSTTQRTFSPEEIVCVYDYGRKVKLSDQTMGDLYLSIEGVDVKVKKLQLRRYVFYTKYGEKMLQEDKEHTDVILYGFAYSREGIETAQGYLAGSQE